MTREHAGPAEGCPAGQAAEGAAVGSEAARVASPASRYFGHSGSRELWGRLARRLSGPCGGAAEAQWGSGVPRGGHRPCR